MMGITPGFGGVVRLCLCPRQESTAEAAGGKQGSVASEAGLTDRFIQ